MLCLSTKLFKRPNITVVLQNGYKYLVFMLKFKDPLAPGMTPGRSQINQDRFVIAMTRGQTGGSFLEIGASDPIVGNNTYILETQFGWRGVSVERITPEYDKFFAEWYKKIKLESWPDNVDSLTALPDWVRCEIEKQHPLDEYAHYHNTQATIDRNKLLTQWKSCRPNSNLITKDAFDIDYSRLPKFFTYLQVDIEPPFDNLQILKKICKHIRFAVITFEHDYYLDSPGSTQALTESRQLLSHQGYHLVADKIENFEDWWVDPDLIPSEVYQHYEIVNDQIKHPADVLFKDSR
jgi:hypothetical protein